VTDCLAQTGPDQYMPLLLGGIVVTALGIAFFIMMRRKSSAGAAFVLALALIGAVGAMSLAASARSYAADCVL